MNIIEKALSDVKFKIPRPILEEGFMRQDQYLSGIRKPVSLDYRIREKVLDARVIPDCNLVGGTELKVPIGSVQPEWLDPYKVVYRIPKNLTENRSITRVYSLVYGHGGAPAWNGLQTQGHSSYLDAASALMDAHNPIPNVSNAYVQLIGENTVLVHANIAPSPYLFLHCLVEADEEFTHIKPTSYQAFSKLVEYATKSYLYNNMIIPMDQAQLSGGMPLGRFRDVIDGYADAEEMYETHMREVWLKVSKMNDPMFLQRHLKMITGGRH